MSIVGVVNSTGQIENSKNLNSRSQQPMATIFLFYENRKENLFIWLPKRECTVRPRVSGKIF